MDFQSVYAQTLYSVQPMKIPVNYCNLLPQCESIIIVVPQCESIIIHVVVPQCESIIIVVCGAVHYMLSLIKRVGCRGVVFPPSPPLPSLDCDHVSMPTCSTQLLHFLSDTCIYKHILDSCTFKPLKTWQFSSPIFFSNLTFYFYFYFTLFCFLHTEICTVN